MALVLGIWTDTRSRFTHLGMGMAPGCASSSRSRAALPLVGPISFSRSLSLSRSLNDRAGDTGDRPKRESRGNMRKHKRGKSTQMEEHAGKRKHGKHRTPGAERTQDALSSATAGFKACSAIALPGEVQEDDGQLLEPVRHIEYTLHVWLQLSREWVAGGAFLWTLGNCMGGLLQQSSMNS